MSADEPAGRRKRPALPTVEEPLRCRGRRGGNRRDGRGLLMRRKSLTVAVALAAASAVVLSACSSSSKGSGGGGTSANNNSNGVSGSASNQGVPASYNAAVNNIVNPS